MKKPAAQEAGEATLLKKPSSQEETPDVPKQEEEEVEGEEEESKEQDPEVDPQKLPVTLQNLKTHEDLLAAKGFTGGQLIAAFKLMAAGEQQKVWKKFEASRKSGGFDSMYQQTTKVGSGSQAKKKEFLRGWLADGAKCGGQYQLAMTSISHRESRELLVTWLTWNQVLGKYGKRESLQRLERGSLKYRKSPSDGKFMEFADCTEVNKHVFAKVRESLVKGKKKGKGKHQQFDELALNDLKAEDFDVDGMDLDCMDLDPAVKTIIQENKSNGDEGSQPSEDTP